MKRNIYMVAMIVALFAVFAIAQTSPDQSQTPSSGQYPSQSTPPSGQSGTGTSGQSSTGTSGQSSTGTSGQGSTGMSSGGSSDAQSAIQAAIQQDQSLASSGVNAKVTDHKVELTGTVSSSADKDKAESIAKANAGGRKVVNKIKVSGGSSDSTPKY
jgi:osmotically-inducible protein OsmY